MQQKKSIRELREDPNKNGIASGNILLKVQPTIKTITNRPFSRFQIQHDKKVTKFRRAKMASIDSSRESILGQDKQ